MALRLGLSALVLAPLLSAPWGVGGHWTRVRLGGLSPAAVSCGTLAVGATSVTFLNPPVARLAAVLYLGEPVTLQRAVGAAVILAGTAMVLGRIGPEATRSPAR
jgi:drug/metabolite transporter (DMT)-like permease